MISTFDFTKNNMGNIKDGETNNLEEYVQVLLSGEVSPLINWLRNPDGLYVFQRELEYCNYYDYVKNWEKALGADNIKVIQFEDFLRNKSPYISHLCEWLDIENEFQFDNEEMQNESFTVKNNWIHHMSVKAARFLPKNKLKNVLKALYFSFQKSEHQKSELTASTKELLNSYFKSSNSKLEKEFAFNLSYWKN